MMMESTTLSMIHRGGCNNAKREQAKVEPRNCKNQRRERRETNTRQRRQNRENRNTTTKNKKPNGQGSRTPLFGPRIESSDAESKVVPRLTGAPPWETQRGCTDELTGSDLVEHEKLGRHP